MGFPMSRRGLTGASGKAITSTDIIAVSLPLAAGATQVLEIYEAPKGLACCPTSRAVRFL